MIKNTTNVQKRLTSRLLAIAVAFSCLQGTADAWGIKNTPLDTGTWGGAARDVRSAVVTSVTKSFRICNRTGARVVYKVDGRTEIANDGSCTKWRSTPGEVSFDWSFRSGYQGESYNLDDGGSYTFERGNIRNGFDLFKS